MNKNIPQNILKGFLCSCNPKLPLSNNHYITGKNLLLFSNFACVENTLSCLTSNFCCKLCNIKKKYGK